MNVRMLSGIKSHGLRAKEHALRLCLQITVQKCNQSARAAPQTHHSLSKLCCVGQGRVFRFTRKGHGGSG